MDDMTLDEALALADLTSPLPTVAARGLRRLRAHLLMLREIEVDRQQLLHALDVALNGEDGAAAKPGLGDLLAQVRQAVRTRGAPLLVERRAPVLDEAAKRIRNTLLADGRNEQAALFDQLLTERHLDSVEVKAREMYEAFRTEHPDARMYPWDQQTFEPTREHWREKARATLAGESQ